MTAPLTHFYGLSLKQERNHEFLGEAKPMGGRNLPPLVEIRVNVSKDLGKAAALHALPLFKLVLIGIKNSS